MHSVFTSLTADQAESWLRPVIAYWTTELILDGCSTPRETCDLIAAEEPELYHILGDKKALELCLDVHRSADLVHSGSCTVDFRRFNDSYFACALDDYRVCVVYDAHFWMPLPSDRPQLTDAELANEFRVPVDIWNASLHQCDHLHPSFVDAANHRIVLGLLPGWRPDHFSGQLLHHMAHIATSTTKDEDPRWIEEMRRLASEGAPIDPEGEL
jgi:hypothetical protein